MAHEYHKMRERHPLKSQKRLEDEKRRGLPHVEECGEHLSYRLDEDGRRVVGCQACRERVRITIDVPGDLARCTACRRMVVWVRLEDGTRADLEPDRAAGKSIDVFDELTARFVRSSTGWVRHACAARSKRAPKESPRSMSKALPGDAGTCKSCNAPIRWVKLPSGKRSPLDAEPTSKVGALVFDGVAAFRNIKDGDPPGHASHFSTCPAAEAHRAKGKKP